ncbi:response regulator transcription factor [Duganella dendranthematis]|uniref:Response regulator transcription factor n=2 Tax=Duganella dendranthematis TaxID=2728021 RepID=A0ABX6ME41_9BURK|nr:response regulator transcription factor [Duganella dendranthematis]
MLEPMRILIADDEAPARRRLHNLLREDAGVTEVREASDGRVALQMVIDWKPDLLLLDVQMPELTGIDMVMAVGAAQLPLTIFVTAWDQHAVSAFQANALDYLLKPYSDARFHAALARARQAMADRQLRAVSANIFRMLASQQASVAPVWLERLIVRSQRATQLVRVLDIDWIESAGVHVILHVKRTELLHRIALSDLASQLDPARFVRVHRSLIVNIDSIMRLEALSHGEFAIWMNDGARRKISRTYRAALERSLGQPL